MTNLSHTLVISARYKSPPLIRPTWTCPSQSSTIPSLRPRNPGLALKLILLAIVLALSAILFRPHLRPCRPSLWSQIIRPQARVMITSDAAAITVDGGSSSLHFRFRPSEDRGEGDLGWLRVRPVLFSPAMLISGWPDIPYLLIRRLLRPEAQQFGALRVVNEDRVAVSLDSSEFLPVPQIPLRPPRLSSLSSPSVLSPCLLLPSLLHNLY